MLKRIFLVSCLLVDLTGQVQAQGLVSASWDALLKKHVQMLRDGQVSQVDYAGYPGIKSIKDLGSFIQSPWKKKFIPLLGESRSLDDIEHGLIRGSGRYNDPRVHFAVNCASVGCPALRAEAYVADRLNVQLEDSTQKFLSDRTRNRLEPDVLNVSSIFKWYLSDFEKGWRGAHTLGQFLVLYSRALALNVDTARRLSTGKHGIEFLDYYWRLNSTGGPAKPGKP